MEYKPKGIIINQNHLKLWIESKGNISACSDLDIERISKDRVRLTDTLYFNVNKDNLCWYCGVPFMEEGKESTYKTSINEIIMDLRDYLINQIESNI